MWTSVLCLLRVQTSDALKAAFSRDTIESFQFQQWLLKPVNFDCRCEDMWHFAALHEINRRYYE
jgi:hypothetical protein